MSKEKIAIGFDLGTTSVGWSIIKINDNNPDEKLEILNMGVRLFEDPASQDNNTEKRRVARSRRRRINRLKIRKFDFFKLLKKFNLISDKEEYENIIRSSIYDEITQTYLLPVEIKIKGLNNKLSKQELILILHNYIKHRGTLNTIDNNEEKTEKVDTSNFKYNASLYACQNQYEWFKSTGKVIGNIGNQIITNEEFIKEIKQILSNQSHLGINQDFEESFLEIFKRHRHYSEGPGSEKSLTKYGRVKIELKNGKEHLVWNGIDENGNQTNLWDLKVGKCTYYPNEKRNYKRSPVTEIYNLLNDLGNLRLYVNLDDKEARTLTLEEKHKILSLPNDKLTLDKMLKEIGWSKKFIASGLKNKNKKDFEIEELKSTRAILKWLKENNINKEINLNKKEDLLFIDNLLCQGVKFQNVNERKQKLNENSSLLKIDLTNEQINKLAELKIYSSGTSSLSQKAQLEFIDFALNDPESIGKNQMNYFTEIKNDLESFDNFSKYEYFPNNYFSNVIMPLTVKRTFNQAIKVLNAIIKQYIKKGNYELSYIIIEMARELNSSEEAGRIKRELDKNKKKLEENLKEHNLTLDDIKGGENRLKFLLWLQQNKRDLYDGKEIDLKYLLSNPTAYNIDHVLPISISFIDSMQNKVLTSFDNNRKKGDKTPYQWLSSEGKFEEYKKRCEKLVDEIQDKNEKAKLQNKIDNYLLYMNDPFNELKGFVERQLNDTRYISREFSNQLKKFFKQSNYWKDKNKVIIHNINGTITSFARNNLFREDDLDKSERLIYKNRDIYNHHAIDASIIAYLGLNHKMQNILKIKNENIIKNMVNGKMQYIDKDTGEVYADKSNFLEEEKPFAKYFRNQMREFLDNNNEKKTIKFSRMIISRDNTPLSNETLYSIKSFKNDNSKKEYKVSKLKILEKDVKDLSKYFGNESQEKYKTKLRIFQEEPNLYNYLDNIFKEQLELIIKNKESAKSNPFFRYLNSDLVKSKIKEIENKDIKVELLDKIPVFNFEKNLITNWIRELKIIENEIQNKDDLLILKGHKNKAFYDSLKPVGIRIYQTSNNKFKLIFLNALNLKWDKESQKLIIDEEKVKLMLDREEIKNHYKYIEIKKGTPILRDNFLYYFNGGGQRQENKAEIKSMTSSLEKSLEINNLVDLTSRKDQWLFPISTLQKKGFKICKVDVLGNIYDVKSFEEFFSEK